jgi:molybdenum cofactor guanylyltransferase
MEKTACSGVALTGGMNIRFGGENKAFVKIGNQTILEKIVSTFNDFFNESLLITNQPDHYLAYDMPIFTDVFPIRSPLCGIHAGLFYAKTPYIFVAACDIPFLKKEMVQTIIREIESGYEVIIPETEKGLEALCAVDSKRCLPIIERQLKEQIAAIGETANPKERKLVRGLKIQRFFDKVRTKRIPEKTLRKADPDLVSFFNVNRPEDYEKALEMRSDLE